MESAGEFQSATRSSRGNMILHQVFIIALYIVLSRNECQGLRVTVTECAVRAETEAGSVCGTLKSYTSREGVPKAYASFRGVPYAKQPMGELRFKPLQPLQPWEGILDASVEGPICPQTEILYGKLMQPHGMSESCINANIHVPIEALPQSSAPSQSGLPVFVFVHGGGFVLGSGDGDLHGPEYLLSKDMIVVTFDYRLGILGFLSLNTTEVPGNNGLRDMVTLLKWVKTNIASFGGNPEEVTLAGQSAGSAAVHLLTLSNAAKGLFKRAICMSGTAVRSFSTTSPVYLQSKVQQYLAGLNITAKDPDQIYTQLKQIPISAILEVNKAILSQGGLSTLNPVIENKLPGVTPILDDDPENLMEQGRGSDIPILFSFTKGECEVFRNRFETTETATKAQQNPLAIVPPALLYKASPATLPEKIQAVQQKYFKSNITTNTFINFCTDGYFIYSAIYAARKRAEIGGAPVYLNQFSYKGDYRVLETVLGRKFKDATHIEDLTDLFKVHSIPGPSIRTQADLDMQFWLPELYSNFAKTGSPSPSWPPLKADDLQYQDINQPKVLKMSRPTKQQQRAVRFFDQLYENV